MELDELKKQLNRRMATAPQEHSVAEIALLLKKDTRSVVQKIKRSLWIELAFSIVFTIGCTLAVALNTMWVYKTFFSIFIFIGLAFITVLGMLLRKTNKLSSSDSIKTNLGSLVLILKEYVKRYLQLGMALLPLCFAFGYWLSYNDPTRVAKPFRWDIFGYLTAYLVIAGTAMYYFSKWYLEKLYGNYIRQLEQVLQEFNENR